MFEVCYDSTYRWLSQRRRYVPMILALLVIAAVWRIARIPLDHNIEKMLPADEEVLGSIRFLRQSGLSEQIVISLSLSDGRVDTPRLTAAADHLARELTGPLVSEARTGIARGDPYAEWEQIVALTPQMLEDRQLSALPGELDADNIDARMAAMIRRLMAPGASVGRFMRTDPLGIAGGVMNGIQSLTAAFGYRVRISGNHLVSEDGRHALMFLKTPVAVTDGFGARNLLAHIDACLSASPEPLEALILAGHRHTVSNEQVIRGDLGRTGIAAAIGFSLLLLAVFRDWRAIMIFMTPLCAILLSIAFSSLLLEELSYFIAGMSVVIAGIAMDYAIHLYVAKRGAGATVLPRVARPVAIGALTTTAVFTALLFSAVPGYRQLAVFSIISLLICLFMALFILPQWVPTTRGKWKTWRRNNSRGIRSRTAWLVIAVWTVCLTLLGLALNGLEFQSDIEQFDGSADEVRGDQRRFHEIWGGEIAPAMLVVEGSEQSRLWRAYEEVTRRGGELIGADNLVSLANPWPSHETREARLAQWRAFWNDHGPGIIENLHQSAREHGFAENAFLPFLEWLPGQDAYDGFPPGNLFEGLRQQFTASDGTLLWAMAYFDDTAENLGKLSALRHDGDDFRVRLISRRTLSDRISGAIAGETLKLAAVAGGLILLPLFLLTGDARMALIALTPVLTSVVAILGVLALFNIPLTAASLIAAMIVVGLVIDYGVYIVYDEHYHVHADAALSIHLSAFTTLVGAGALLLARHPVMFDIGVTLVTGVTIGYLCALWVVPALYRVTKHAKLNPALPAIAICLMLAGGCVGVPFERVPLERIDHMPEHELRRSLETASAESFSLLQSVVFQYRGRSMAAICVTRIDLDENAFSIAAMTPLGMKLFEIAGRDGLVDQRFLAPGLDEWGDPSKAIAKDIQRVYFHPLPPRNATLDRWRRLARFRTPLEGGRIDHIVGGMPPVLLEKRRYDEKGIVWDAVYREYIEHQGHLYAGGIVFNNRRHGYRLVLRLREVLVENPETVHVVTGGE